MGYVRFLTSASPRAWVTFGSKTSGKKGLATNVVLGGSDRAVEALVACPFFGDQPFWGRRIAQLGVGPLPLDRKTLSASKLASRVSLPRYSTLPEVVRTRTERAGCTSSDMSPLVDAGESCECERCADLACQPVELETRNFAELEGRCD